jgi:hypothetical protein
MAAPAVVLNSFFVDRRLETIHKAMNADDMKKAISVTNETLRTLKNAPYADPDWDMKLHDFILTNLYTTLVDIAMGRKMAAQSKIRDCHYHLFKTDMEKYDDTDYQEELFETLSFSDAAPEPETPTASMSVESMSVHERDYELEELLATLFGTYQMPPPPPPDYELQELLSILFGTTA